MLKTNIKNHETRNYGPLLKSFLNTPNVNPLRNRKTTSKCYVRLYAFETFHFRTPFNMNKSNKLGRQGYLTFFTYCKQYDK